MEMYIGEKQVIISTCSKREMELLDREESLWEANYFLNFNQTRKQHIQCRGRIEEWIALYRDFTAGNFDETAGTEHEISFINFTEVIYFIIPSYI